MVNYSTVAVIFVCCVLCVYEIIGDFGIYTASNPRQNRDKQYAVITFRPDSMDIILRYRYLHDSQVRVIVILCCRGASTAIVRPQNAISTDFRFVSFVMPYIPFRIDNKLVVGGCRSNKVRCYITLKKKKCCYKRL